MLGLVEDVGMGGGLRLRPSSSSEELDGKAAALAGEEEEEFDLRRRRRWMERRAERRMRQRESRERSRAWSTGKPPPPPGWDEECVLVWGVTRLEMLAGKVGRPPSPAEEEGSVRVIWAGGGGWAAGKKGLLVKG